MTQATVIIDKAVAMKTKASLFPKRSILVQFQVRTPLSFVFEMGRLFHSISRRLIHFQPICGGKVGDAENLKKDLVLFVLDIIIGFFGGNFKLVRGIS